MASAVAASPIGAPLTGSVQATPRHARRSSAARSDSTHADGTKPHSASSWASASALALASAASAAA
eukprot:4621166-Pleurochrysis_carterae.AAC.1